MFYLVFAQYDYEGTSLLNMFTTKELAVTYAKKALEYTSSIYIQAWTPLDSLETTVVTNDMWYRGGNSGEPEFIRKDE